MGGGTLGERLKGRGCKRMADGDRLEETESGMSKKAEGEKGR